VTNVEVVRVARGAVASYQVANGTLDALQRAPVYSRNNEICLEVLAKENDVVTAGTVLARLEPSRYKNALDRAQAAVDRAIQRVREAEIEAKKSHADYVRLLKVVEEGLDGQFIAKDEIDRARVTSEKASVLHEASKADQLSAESDFRNAQLDLDNCLVKAPIDGVVTLRKIEPNELVKVDQELFQIAELDMLRLKAELPETAITMLRDPPRLFGGGPHDVDIAQCQAVLLAGTAYPNERFLGYLELVSQVVTDPTRGMFGVQIRVVQPADAAKPDYAALLAQFPPPEREAVLATARRAKARPEGAPILRLRPGNFLEASIVTAFKQDTLVIPTSCLVDSDRAVFVIDEPAPSAPTPDAPGSAVNAKPEALKADKPDGAAPTASNGERSSRPSGERGGPNASGTGRATGGGRPGADSAGPTGSTLVKRVSLAGHLGMSSEGYTEILATAPVKLGDRLVFRGQEYLKDQAPVNIVTPPKS